MRLTSSLLTTNALRAIGSSGTSINPNRDGFVSLTTIQFGSRIGIGPMTVDAVVIKTAAAILIVTGQASVKMVAAEILVANRA